MPRRGETDDTRHRLGNHKAMRGTRMLPPVDAPPALPRLEAQPVEDLVRDLAPIGDLPGADMDRCDGGRIVGSSVPDRQLPLVGHGSIVYALSRLNESNRRGVYCVWRWRWVT